MLPILILIIGIILIGYSSILMKKDNTDDNYKSSFDLVLRNSEEDMNDYKMEMGVLRKDIGESLTELQQDIIEIRREINKIKENSNNNENVNKEFPFEENNMAEKARGIKELLDLGIDEEEICKKLSVGKGEVLLVKGLYNQ